MIKTSLAPWNLRNSLTFQVSLAYLELAQNPLVKRVIAVLDKNTDGKISFLEFVQGLSSLSVSATNEEKL